MLREHPAIEWKRQGRGYGVAEYPYVKLGLIGAGGKSWHILDPNSPICGARGHVVTTLGECNPATVRISGRPVCKRCRKQLGQIPMPRTPIKEAV